MEAHPLDLVAHRFLVDALQRPDVGEAATGRAAVVDDCVATALPQRGEDGSIHLVRSTPSQTVS